MLELDLPVPAEGVGQEIADALRSELVYEGG
jgi:hypothetical protein